MSAVEAKAATEKVSLKKSYEAYNDNLELVTKEDVPVEFEIFTTDASLELVMSKLNALNQWREAANFLIRKEALRLAKQVAGVSGGINRAVLMEFIKPYRELPNFAGMISSSDKRKATAEEWNKQTSAILDQIKNVPFIMNSIREASAKANEADE